MDQGINDDKRKVVLCKWKGYDDTDNTLERFTNSEGILQYLANWEAEMEANFSKADIRAHGGKRRRVQQGTLTLSVVGVEMTHFSWMARA